MTLLYPAALAWIAVHIGIAGTAVRQALVGRLGDGAFRVGFSLASVATISLLIIAYKHALGGDTGYLWSVPAWLGWVLVALMAAAFVLFVASVTVQSPTAVGGEKALDGEARGILRVTRHPMLWSFTIWSAVHVIGNGNLASLVFFGAFGVTSLVGMPSIDRKLAAREPSRWPAFAGKTSIIPFAAIAAGRNRLSIGEIGIVPFAVGLIVWGVLLYFHPRIFGVSPLPSS